MGVEMVCIDIDVNGNRYRIIILLLPSWILYDLLGVLS